MLRPMPSQYGRHSSGRVVISRLYEGYPAYRAEDLQVGDVISSINGETVDGIDDAYRCPSRSNTTPYHSLFLATH